MAKEKPVKKPVPIAARVPTLPALRGKIDHIDQEIVKLMNDRAKLAHEIGKLKHNAGISAYAPAREDEVLTRVLSLNRGPLDERCVGNGSMSGSLRMVPDNFRKARKYFRTVDLEDRLQY